ncbi:MAG: hypothetical protein ABH881_02380 [bacterium]
MKCQICEKEGKCETIYLHVPTAFIEDKDLKKVNGHFSWPDGRKKEVSLFSFRVCEKCLKDFGDILKSWIRGALRES